MGKFTVGDVVLVPFPYADFSQTKKRPALIVGLAEFDNLILCQITSQANTSSQAISLASDAFSTGKLPLTSYIRPDKLFTVEPSLILTKLGTLRLTKITLVKAAIRAIFA